MCSAAPAGDRAIEGQKAQLPGPEAKDEPSVENTGATARASLPYHLSLKLLEKWRHLLFAEPSCKFYFISPKSDQWRWTGSSGKGYFLK